jgi:hypothetical protein
MGSGGLFGNVSKRCLAGDATDVLVGVVEEFLLNDIVELSLKISSCKCRLAS